MYISIYVRTLPHFLKYLYKANIFLQVYSKHKINIKHETLICVTCQTFSYEVDWIHLFHLTFSKQFAQVGPNE